MLVVCGRLAGLGGELAGMRDQRRVLGHEHAAARRGDDLVAVERVDAGAAESPGRPPIVGGAERLGRVFHESDPEVSAHVGDGGEVGALAVQVHQHDRSRQLSDCGPDRESLRQQGGIHVPGSPLAIDEYRNGTLIDYGVDGCHEGQRTDQHLVSGPHADEPQGEVQGRGAGVDCHGVRRANDLGEFALEGLDVGAKRRDYVAGEGVRHEPLFGVSQVGWGEEDSHEEWLRRCSNSVQHSWYVLIERRTLN
jgi:hypothetical protein